jgi:hypothetical protein
MTEDSSPRTAAEMIAELEARKEADRLRRRLMIAAVAATVAVFVVWGKDGLLYPYRLVRLSFEYANGWAEEQHGGWLKRLFILGEVIGVAWFALLAFLAWGVMSDAFEKFEDAYGAAVLLVVALLPFAPFVWALVSTFGWPDVTMLATWASGG